jgi:hypothetical protein
LDSIHPQQDNIYKLKLTTGDEDVEYLMQPDTVKCSSRLLAVIISQRRHQALRDAIRQTWASEEEKQKYGFDIIFVLSGGTHDDTLNKSQLVDEQHLHHDILLTNLTESYDNLTRKTLAVFTWVAHRCTTRFVLKTDDDVVIAMDKIHEYLMSGRDEVHSAVMGVCYDYTKVIRDANHKWYAFTYSLLCNYAFQV